MMISLRRLQLSGTYMNNYHTVFYATSGEMTSVPMWILIAKWMK